MIIKAVKEEPVIITDDHLRFLRCNVEDYKA